jgi:hypothetical protein
VLLVAEAGWTSIMTGAFKATYIFGYIVCVMFMLFFLTLLLMQGAVTKEIGICESTAWLSWCCTLAASAMLWQLAFGMYSARAHLHA